jgi:cytochrome c553
MIKRWVNNKKMKLSLVIILFISIVMGYSTVYAVFIEDNKTQHHYLSYHQFAQSNCQPCHYRGITNGTDLSTLFTLPENQLKNYLQPILKEGNMPPEPILRSILYRKFLSIDSQ